MGKEEEKKLVGEKVVDLIKSHSTIGMGTGSTVFYTIQELGKRMDEGKLEGVRIVCTSKDTEEKAHAQGIETVDVNDVEGIELAIDGADEFDAEKNLIKGGGGALTREKIVDYLADKLIIIADSSKQRNILGDFPVPVEVLPFAWFQTKKGIEALGASVSIRMRGKEHYVTDNGNFILDAKFSHIMKPARLEDLINNIPGVVDNGVFRGEKIYQVWMAQGDKIVKMPE